jgi:calcium-translocating P-type ATPase
VVRLESGERLPLPGTVIEGFGTATDRGGLPIPVMPREELPAGVRLYGGPFVVELGGHDCFVAEPRLTPPRPTLYQRYLKALSPVSLAYAGLTALLTRSVSRTFQAMLLVNPRPAMIGAESADMGASARVLRAGVTVVGTRTERVIRRPDVLLFDGVRTLADGWELAATEEPDHDEIDRSELEAIAQAVAFAAGSPWGGVFAAFDAAPNAGRVGAGRLMVEGGRFDGRRATATVDGVTWTLGPASRPSEIAVAVRRRHHGEHLLVLQRDGETAESRQVAGVFALRPRLAAGVSHLIELCRRHGVEVGLLAAGHKIPARAMAARAGISVLEDESQTEAVRRLQAGGAVVALASDSAHGAEAFGACDLAIGLHAGHTAHFAARADLLAPDLYAVGEIVEAGARRDAAVRDSVAISVLSNIAGAVLGLRTALGVARAGYAVYAASLGALGITWLRLRGGERASSTIAHLVDPRPERWGRRGVEETLRRLRSRESGLSLTEAVERRQVDRPLAARNGIVTAALAQLRSPLTGILAAGAALAVVLGSAADVVMIGATIAANVAVGAWQERQAEGAVAALEQIGAATARVLRDDAVTQVATDEIVPGDVLVLASGDRVAADARLIRVHGLEVDEAALTGESMPVAKRVSNGAAEDHIVLAGSDVTVGNGLAVVFAVGRRTRMGATAAALAIDETRASPLGVRLNRMLRGILPLAGAGGVIVILSGLLRRQPVLPQLAIGTSIALAAVPEGLPLLAGVGEAAVARRLAGRQALVRRLAAVEALGRVDITCTDKTGTLTEGRLALTSVATMTGEGRPKPRLSADLRAVLVAAGLATPHPDAPGASAHPTDTAVVEGVRAAGLAPKLDADRVGELAFDPTRGFHATRIQGTEANPARVYIKGAVEELAPRCTGVRRNGRVRALDDAGRETLLARGEELAARGLRVLMAAEAPADTPLDDPRDLVALGFLGISDPLRPGVPEAVRRCREAGVRVIMLTGDHPATARTIAREAGILTPSDNPDAEILTGPEIAALDEDALGERLERTAVIARVTPLDKLCIVESLQRRGHAVAMTGDGVNDGPALRLADVGVAMGQAGTEVARQAADIVLAEDDFSALVEALVEGRSFWRNIRRSLALLLGGNLGELGLVVGASVLGAASPLLTRQILAVNLVTDVLPSLAVAIQPPESRHLSALAREGTAALDAPLRRDVLRRGTGTAVPALIAYLASLRTGTLAQARSVAFASIVCTQLAQTLDMGRAEGTLTRSVLGAVAGSAAVLLATFTVPPLQAFLGLAMPSPAGWLLIGAGSLAAVLLGRGLSLSFNGGRRLLPRPALAPVS